MSTHATKSIGKKILSRSLLIAIPPLVLLAVVVLIGVQSLSSNATDRVEESRATLAEESARTGSQDQAISVAREINVVLRERVRDVASWARTESVVDTADDAAGLVAERNLTVRTIDELEAEFSQNRALNPFSVGRNFLIEELDANADFLDTFFTDVNGFTVSGTSTTDQFVHSEERWWQEAVANGLSLSDVKFDAASNQFSVDVAVRIDQPDSGRVLGVLQSSLSISFIQSITTERSLDNVEYTIALADGRLIADTESGHEALRMMAFSSSPGLIAAIDEDLDPGASSTLVTDEFIYGYTSTLTAEQLDVGIDGFSGFDWIVMSSQPTAVALAPLQGLEQLSDDIRSSGRNLALVAALVLINGIAAAVFLARRMTRQIVEPVRALTDAASLAAADGLPSAVHKINEDDADIDDIDVPTVEIATNDELQTLASSFNSVQQTALRLAAEQAKSRRNNTEMFVNLGRRNQSLLKRQLRFIDTLEQNEQDPDTLESLFKLDHLATRMRRNAESLLVLAGDRSPRRWAAPIDVRSAVEAALAEVENYERVDFSSMGEGQVQGNIVADVAHIFAELVENALSFSPPTTDVVVSGETVDDHYVVTIADQGFGMKPEEIELVNKRLATVVDITDVPTQQLGLFVVARLANRHGINVALADAASGGLSVRVEVPLAEVKADAEASDDTPDTNSDEVAAAQAEVAAAQAEVEELLAKAEQAMAKVAEVRAERSDEDVAEEERRFAEIRAKAGLDSDDKAEAASDADDLEASDDIDESVEDENENANDDEGATEPVVAATEESEAVEVGDFSFPRRGGNTSKAASGQEGKAEKAKPAAKAPEKGRRKSDPVEEPAAEEASPAAADLETFGFSRRESKRSSKSGKHDRRKSDSSKKSTTAGSDDDVAVVAEKSRSQWGSFQKGKQDAEAVSADSKKEQ